MKKTRLLIIVLALAFSMSTFSGLHAYGHKGCPQKKDKGMKEMFFDKVKFVYVHQDELGISKEQIDAIKKLKYKTKKDLIAKKAEIDVIAVDIKALMWEKTINVEEVNKLIDQKYELKKEKAKILVAACAEMRNILTDEQKDNVMKMHREMKKMKMMHKKHPK